MAKKIAEDTAHTLGKSGEGRTVSTVLRTLTDTKENASGQECNFFELLDPANFENDD